MPADFFSKGYFTKSKHCAVKISTPAWFSNVTMTSSECAENETFVIQSEILKPDMACLICVKGALLAMQPDSFTSHLDPEGIT